MIKKSLLGLCLLSSIGYCDTTATQTWKVSKIIKDYKTEYYCNNSISEKYCKSNLANIKKLAGYDFKYNKNIKSVELNTITYTTKNTFPKTGEEISKVSGLLMMPNIDKPKGVIIYYHPTVFDNQAVPSNLDKNPVSKKFDNTYAAIYAANGYIVVAPDYIGQGIDYNNSHPYVLFPKQSVNTAVDLLNDVSSMIQKKYNLDKDDTLNLYSVGYSEGGAYSIWNAKCMQSPDACKKYVHKLDELYRYRAAAGLSGAYNLSDVMINFMEEDNDSDKYLLQSKLVTSATKPALVADAMLSYMNYGDIDNKLSIKNDFDDSFYNMQCSTFKQEKCDLKGKHYNLNELLNQKHLANSGVATSIFNSAIYKKYPNQESVSHYFIPTGNNSMFDLFNQNMFYDRGLINTMKEADITNFSSETTTPLFIFRLAKDSIVTPLNTVAFMKNANALVTQYTLDNSKIIANTIKWLPIMDINEVDHLTGEGYANIFAYNYINQINEMYT